MKALHVLHRVCHYIALWLFVVAGVNLVLALTLSWIPFAGGVFVAWCAWWGLGWVLVAVCFLVKSILFRQIRDKVARKCSCRECCCCKEEKAVVHSDLDAQVEEVLKWKNLYVEGIITEREFIDKRNEILRISR